MIMDESELAVDILNEVLKIHFTLGTLYTTLKDSEQALANYEKIAHGSILKLLPTNIIGMIYDSLGEVCVLQKNFYLAIINTEIAIGVELLRQTGPHVKQLAHYYHTIGEIHASLKGNNQVLTYC